ncbi:hypothetical protein SLEP1_g14668 [Rubroshorea leprosula]|uniref:Uncharacterized protein n=1 Tax=Rubroshorea leprosula TaxID=152421 RepID=A0AAV5ISR7_9ROSI|nr:hypothetical protein SLEP1_g14668 [Rubroshorea leprosula]
MAILFVPQGALRGSPPWGWGGEEYSSPWGEDDSPISHIHLTFSFLCCQSLLSNPSPLLLLKPSTLLLPDPSAMLLLLLKTSALLLLLPKLAAESISFAAAEAIYFAVAGSICSAAIATEAYCRIHLLYCC